MTLFSQRTPARYLLLFADGPTVLFDFFGCEHLAAGIETIDQIRPALGLCHVSSGGRVAESARELAAQIDALYRDHVGAAADFAIDRFPLALSDALRELGYRLGDCDEVFSAARKRKLALELPFIREAMRRVESAVTKLAESIAPGRRECEVWAEFHRDFIASEGQYVSTRLVQSGERTFPYFQECSDRELRAGDLFCIDTDAIGYRGYAVDFSRTFIVGDAAPTAAQSDLYHKAREQLEHNVALIRPGASYAEIAAAAWPVPAAHQASRYYCIGHGLGMSGEFPNIPHAIAGQEYPLDGELEAGMILCIESYIGSERSGEGVKLEEQLLVTDSGVEVLSQFPFDDRF